MTGIGRLMAVAMTLVVFSGVFAVAACVSPVPGQQSGDAGEAAPTPTLGPGCVWRKDRVTMEWEVYCLEPSPDNISGPLWQKYSYHMEEKAFRQTRGETVESPVMLVTVSTSTEEAVDDVLDYLDGKTRGRVDWRKGGDYTKGLVSAEFSIELLPEVAAIEGVQLIEEPNTPVDSLDCDNLLQQKLVSLTTVNADEANAVIAGLQAQRPSYCPSDVWNPVVASVAGDAPFTVDVPSSLSEDGSAGPGKRFVATPWRDDLGNIGIDFDPPAGTARGFPVTLPLDGGERWVYLAPPPETGERWLRHVPRGIWYAASPERVRVSTPVLARVPVLATELPMPPQTEVNVLLCDNALQQRLLALPLATANADNANAVIEGVQEGRHRDDLSPRYWNPWVTATAGDTAFGIAVPSTLSGDGSAAADSVFEYTPQRDIVGNIGVDFVHSGDQRGAPVTPPWDGARRWMYLVSHGVWFRAVP